MRSAAPAQKPTGDPSTDLLPDRSPSAPRRNGCPTFWAVSRPVLAEARCGVIARYRRTGKSNEEPLNVISCGWRLGNSIDEPTISSISERSPTCGSDELASPHGGLTPRPGIAKLVFQVRQAGLGELPQDRRSAQSRKAQMRPPQIYVVGVLSKPLSSPLVGIRPN